MSFNTKLTDLLKTNPNFVDDEGDLLLAAVQDKAWKLDHDLIRLLLSDDEMKATFFDAVAGSLLFNTKTFIEYISQKNFLDNSYTRFRNRIGLTIDGKYLDERGEVSLAWAYKDCVLEGGQTKEEEKRKEIFFNEVLAQDEINRMFDPKVLTNFTRYSTAGAQPVEEFKRDENGIIRENLIIKGNNLIVLHTLKDQFRGRVKLIYIDPPYNTGNDSFSYNDKFSRSTFLTFLRNRLLIARDLLSPDGAIAIQISDKHVGYLHVLMDEIFPDGFINKFSIDTRSPSGFKTVNLGVFESAEYILLYGKERTLWKYIPQFVESSYDENYSYQISNIDEPYPKWKIVNIKDVISKKHGYSDSRTALRGMGTQYFMAELAQYALDNASSVFRLTTINSDASIETLEAKKNSLDIPGSIIFVPRENFQDRYITNGQEITFYKHKVKKIKGVLVPTTMLTNIWTDIPWEGIASEGKVKLKKGKKPERLIQRLISMSTEKETDIVMDFFLGSGTTAAVAHKMHRQYIGIEQLEYEENDSLVRLGNVIKGEKTGISREVGWKGGGNFVYCELMKYNQSFIHRIKEANNSEQLLQIWQDVAENSFLNWYVNPKLPDDAINDFIKIAKEENGLVKQKKLLMELLDKNQLYVNLSEIDDAKFNVSEEDKALNKAFYGED